MKARYKSQFRTYLNSMYAAYTSDRKTVTQFSGTTFPVIGLDYL